MRERTLADLRGVEPASAGEEAAARAAKAVRHGGDSPLLTIVYHGNPETKKNSPQIVTFKDGRRPMVFPSREYRRAEKAAVKEIHASVLGNPWTLPLDSAVGSVHVCALFYCGSRQRPDLDGLIAACADILQTAGVLANDYAVQSWDGTRRLRDRDNPRTEITIRRFMEGT